MLNISKFLILLFFTGFLVPTFALEGESIIFNPSTGNYAITYLNSTDDTLRQITFIPATKFTPILTSNFMFKEGIVHYGYKLTNVRESQQSIVSLILDPVSSVTSRLPDVPLNAPPGKIMDDMDEVAKFFETPKSWEAFMTYSNGQMAFRVGWGWGYKLKTGGLIPGDRVSFGFKSRDLPSIIRAKVRGYAPDSKQISGDEPLDSNDGGFGQQYTELVDRKDFVPRPVAVPTISVPNPFNASVLIERIQTQMHTWIAMQLLDATFSSQLDRYLVAAANAYRLNQPKAGKEHIQTLRKMLKKEHDDADKDDDKEDGKHEGKNDDKSKRLPIDRLAARVLDFNLKYVLKRMGGEE